MQKRFKKRSCTKAGHETRGRNQRKAPPIEYGTVDRKGQAGKGPLTSLSRTSNHDGRGKGHNPSRSTPPKEKKQSSQG